MTASIVRLFWLSTKSYLIHFPELPVSVLNDVKGLHLIVLYVVVGKERFPWSFLIWRGKDTIKPSNLALRLLGRIPLWFKNLCTDLEMGARNTCCSPGLGSRLHLRLERNAMRGFIWLGSSDCWAVQNVERNEHRFKTYRQD